MNNRNLFPFMILSNKYDQQYQVNKNSGEYDNFYSIPEGEILKLISIADLTLNEHDCLYRRYFLKMTYSEIGLIVGLSHERIRQIIARGKRKISRYLRLYKSDLYIKLSKLDFSDFVY